MGGLGSGGHPTGGRKPKTDHERWLGGNAGGRAADAPPTPGVEVPMPAGLDPAIQAVWGELSAHAHRACTLTSATASAFRDLCESVVLRDELITQIRAEGFTYAKVTIDGSGQEHTEPKAHPLLAQYRGLCQRIDGAKARFRLGPVGKPMVEGPVTPADPFAIFDGEAH